MNKETFWNLVKRMSGKQKLFAFGLSSLLAIGALGAMSEFSGNKNGIISNLAETVGLKKKDAGLPPQTGTPQLSKEFVYAGSRMLSVEDNGIAPMNQQAQNEQTQPNDQNLAQQPTETVEKQNQDQKSADKTSAKSKSKGK